MPTPQESRHIAASWLIAENQREPALAELLAPKVADLFAPAKQITAEHFDLICRTAPASGPTNPDLR